jgi:D-lyxose ketol-isomerase
MKRSEINAIMMQGVDLLRRMNFLLPPFAFWSPEIWRQQGPECRAIVQAQLGWDVTDFGANDFERVGLFLFTIRNGTLADVSKSSGKTYAEKVLIVQEGQVTPTHFHHRKMEDIINRGGGKLVVQLWNATPDDRLAESAVTVAVDAISRPLSAGDTLVLNPGESVCLPPRLYHSFWGQPGMGTVLVGEVSRVNDDHADNRFYEQLGRFPAVVEDVAPLYLLCNDYPRYYKHCG